MRLTLLILIVFAGLLLRLDSAWKGTPENLPDSVAYEQIANGIADYGVFEQRGAETPSETQSASNYSPGLPLLVGGIFEVFGSDSDRLARILLALIASLAIPLAYLLGTRLAGEAAGLVGAAVVAFYPTLIGDAGMLLTEPLAGTLLIAAVLLLLVARDHSVLSSSPAPADPLSRIRFSGLLLWAGSGILFGLTAMVRPEYLGILAVVAVISWLVPKSGALTRNGIGPVALVLGAVLVVAPWTARNLFDEGRLIPLSTGGGQTLFAGSYLPSEGDPQKVLPALFESRPELAEASRVRASGGPSRVAPEIVFEELAAREMPGVPTDIALSRLGRSQYLDAMVGQPLELAMFLGNKAHRIWWRGRGSLTDQLPGKLFHWVIASLSLIGLLAMLSRRRFEAILIGGIFLGATAVGVLFIASPRRALVLWPLVSSFAGVGAVLAVSVLARLLPDRSRPVALP